MQTGSSLPGIIVTVLFGAIAIGGMVWGIIHFASHSHEDLHAFPVSLAPQATATTPPFSLAPDGEVSLWLLTDSRLLELKDVRVQVAVTDAAGATVGTVGQNFGGMTVRNRYGDRVYYWLGDFTPAGAGPFHLRYARSGAWADTPPPAQLVVRKALPFSLPWPAVGLFLVGLAGIYAGIRLLIGSR